MSRAFSYYFLPYINVVRVCLKSSVAMLLLPRTKQVFQPVDLASAGARCDRKTNKCARQLRPACEVSTSYLMARSPKSAPTRYFPVPRTGLRFITSSRNTKSFFFVADGSQLLLPVRLQLTANTDSGEETLLHDRRIKTKTQQLPRSKTIRSMI